MPKIVSQAKQSEGWKPLPAGSYDITIDSVEVKPNKNNNDNIQVKGHVADGPHASKKVTIFYVILPQTMWKIRDLFYAAGAPYEEVELDQLDEEGKALLEATYDPDDLIGVTIRYKTVIEDEYNGKPNNKFSGECPLDEEPREATPPAAAPAAKAAPAAAAAATAATKPAPAAAAAKAATPAAAPAAAGSARRPVPRGATR